jgi:hypothetical protein
MPDSDLKVIPGAGHFAMEDAPEGVTRELRDFFTVGDPPMIGSGVRAIASRGKTEGNS